MHPTFLDPPVLLNDSAMAHFIREGYLTLRSELPRSFHEEVYRELTPLEEGILELLRLILQEEDLSLSIPFSARQHEVVEDTESTTAETNTTNNKKKGSKKKKKLNKINKEVQK